MVFVHQTHGQSSALELCQWHRSIFVWNLMNTNFSTLMERERGEKKLDTRANINGEHIIDWLASFIISMPCAKENKQLNFENSFWDLACLITLFTCLQNRNSSQNLEIEFLFIPRNFSCIEIHFSSSGLSIASRFAPGDALEQETFKNIQTSNSFCKIVSYFCFILFTANQSKGTKQKTF